MSELESATLWKQATELLKVTDEIGQMIPGHEFYTIADAMHRTAVILTSDIAMIVGRDSLKDSEYDLRNSRGRLFTIEGLLLVSKDAGYMTNIDGALAQIQAFKQLLDEQLTEIKRHKEADEKK